MRVHGLLESMRTPPCLQVRTVTMMKSTTRAVQDHEVAMKDYEVSRQRCSTTSVQASHTRKPFWQFYCAISKPFNNRHSWHREFFLFSRC